MFFTVGGKLLHDLLSNRYWRIFYLMENIYDDSITALKFLNYLPSISSYKDEIIVSSGSYLMIASIS
jgi:hypothetical protein